MSEYFRHFRLRLASFGFALAILLAILAIAYQTPAAHAVEGDADDDGIADAIDGRIGGDGSFIDESATPSQNFTDQHLGGTSFGSLVQTSLVSVSVQDAADAADGFQLDASGLDFPGIFGVLSLCNAPTFMTNGDSAIVTCGSVTLEVLIGPVEMQFADGAIVVIVPSGSTAIVTEIAGGMFEIANSSESADNVTIEFGEQTITVPPGDSATPGVVEPQLINDLLSLDGLDTSYDPTDDRASAGVFTISATFSNVSTSEISGIFFEVAQISDHATLLGTYMGAPAIEDEILSPGESFEAKFEIGLDSPAPFTFFVNAMGVVSP